MKRFRKHRRPGNRAMTQEESALVDAAKDCCCIACYVWASQGHMPQEHIATVSAWDHKKSGNIRRGHSKGFANCDWHHQEIVPDGWTHARMRKHYGPSLMDGSKLFARTYGTDDELIALQRELLGMRAAA
jgi:hypothetical protein